ncbi:MAG: rod-binding protein [Opitutae bacterium]|nr:rod-binding protein [Opitutae bacterium]
MSAAAVSPVSHHARPAHDLAALKRGNLDPAEQRQAVGEQFEAILIRQFLAQSLGSLMGDGKEGGGGVYGYMLTDTLADKLTQGGGLGLAPVITRQLSPRGKPAPAPAAPQPR